MNGHLTEKDLLMANKCMEKWPTSVAIREMKLKPQKRYHHTPIRIMKIKHSDNIRCCQGCKGTGSGKCFYWKCKMGEPLGKRVWQLLTKLNMCFP